MHLRYLIALGICLCGIGVSAVGEALKQISSISEQEAVRIAVSKVPGGTVESAKLEKEGKNLLWSVDVKMPNSRNITEVHIEAKTGKVMSVQVETPAQQAAEAVADRKKRSN